MATSTEGLHLGTQATLRIALPDGRTVYIDPFQIKRSEHADLILITHPHFDHFDLASIERLYRKGCIVCVPAGAEEIYKIAAREDVRMVKPGGQFELQGIRVSTIPAYNLVAGRTHYHSKENQWVGYVLSMNERTIYHAGDTDRIPEMKSLHGKVGVAFLPIGGTYTMDAREAAGAVEDIAPQTACPMHTIPAGSEAAQRQAQDEFKRLVESKPESKGKIKVEIINGKGIFD